MLTSHAVRWTSQSVHAGESMPLGGFDTGCNVWVENDALFLYCGQSAAFDEQRQILKAGRVRVTFDRPVLRDGFSQALRPETGDILVKSDEAEILLWADMYRSAVHIEVTAKEAVGITCAYEIWRDDTVTAADGAITSVAEGGSTVEIRDENGEKMYLKRTDENTFKIDGCSNRFAAMEDFPNDMVFTFAAEQ